MLKLLEALPPSLAEKLPEELNAPALAEALTKVDCLIWDGAGAGCGLPVAKEKEVKQIKKTVSKRVSKRVM